MASPAAASPASSSPPPQAPPQLQPPPSRRRLPPPCWSNDETGALVEAYRDKWATLRRGNLKAADWQDVADAVASRCGPSKTALQCRHKIEKLRKRYRNEKRRLLSSANHRASSSWIHYLTFDAMESATAPASASRSKPSLVTVTRAPPPPPSPSSSSEEDEDDRSAHRVMSNGAGARFRTPKTEQRSNFSRKSESFLPKSTMNKYLLPSKKRPVVADDPAMEMVWAIRQLGEGFLRVEKMKMEVGREVERMRAEMEMERTEMILASQQQILLSLGSRGGAKMKSLKTSNGKI